MIEYAGVVMVLNAAVQCLILKGVNRMYIAHSHWLRIILAGAIGGLYTGICLLSRFSSLAALQWHLLALAMCGVLAFGVSKNAWRQIAVYILLNMAIEGIAIGLDANTHWSVIVAVVVVCILCGCAAYGKKAGAHYIPVEIYYKGRRVQITALKDTGNMLTDPLTGQQVLVVDPRVASSITGLTQQQLRNPLEGIKNAALPGLRLIPYRTVGQERAFLLALKMHVKLGNTSGKYLVAFAPEMFGKVGTYQALAGGVDL